MPQTLTLVIDQGTHSTRAVLFDAHGRRLALAREAVALTRRSHSQIEQSPAGILASLHTVLDAILRHPAVRSKEIGSVGLATQRSSVLAWEHPTGKALSPVLSWQDTRTAAQLKAYASREEEIRTRTGLRLSPHYGAGKLQWLLANNAAVARADAADTLVLGPLASYLLHHLTQESRELVDDANASRTLLWNLGQRNWDSWLGELFGIPLERLPDCLPICADYGLATVANIPLTAVNGDQTAALYAHGAPDENTILVNIGTGAFVLLPTGDCCRLHRQLLTGIARSDARTRDYYIEGTVNGAGAAVQWIEKRCAVSGWKSQLPGWLDNISDPPVFINTVGGLGAPWWRPGPAPALLEPDRLDSIDPPHAMVAGIESIVFLIQANIEILRNLNPAVERIKVSGGLSQLDGLCQRLASLSGLAVERPQQREATARGIAWLASGCPEGWEPVDSPAQFQPAEDTGLRHRYRRFRETLESLADRHEASWSGAPNSSRNPAL